MTFPEMLKALAAGKVTYRPSGNGLFFHLSEGTLPLCIYGLMGSLPTPTMDAIKDNWFLCRVPLITANHGREPDRVGREPDRVGNQYAFSDIEVAATDWEIAT